MKTSQDTSEVDTKYREDQFYAGLTYDLLVNRSKDVNQQSFSRGIHLGLLRDMPFNERRTLAVAIGLGYSYDLVYSNILALPNKGKTEYYIGDLQKNNISKSYFSMHSVEVPVEFRWRNSTPYSHKFWRIYTGVKVAYVFSATTFFRQGDLNISFSNSDITKTWQFKFYTAFGYNTWNFYLQYSFLPLYKGIKAQKGQLLECNILQMGLMFYIL